MDNNQIIYKFEQFEGPLDLLLTLISKNKMSIEDIQISVICDQYIEYISNMQSMNMALSAEFIVMASELIYIKSKMLLPRADDSIEDDPRAQLVAALQYQMAKAASPKLRDLYVIYGGRMVKDTDEISADRSYVAEHDINLLTLSFNRVMNSIVITDEEASENIKPLISTKTISVNERVYHIMRLLIVSGGTINVIDCFDGVTSKHEAVATFMAVLEMLKFGRLSIGEYEEDLTGVIDIEKNVYVKLNDGKINSSQEGEQNNG